MQSQSRTGESLEAEAAKENDAAGVKWKEMVSLESFEIDAVKRKHLKRLQQAGRQCTDMRAHESATSIIYTYERLTPALIQ